ncbi:MAG: ABC transporter permease [Anaerolineae bacterium]|nr:ABC transporter permease [Anaerolineales bacterium]MCQ3974322.1 ABC transporter permease [Anaerolineae bacterium]
MHERVWLRLFVPVLSSILAVVAAFLCGALFLWLTGKDPGQAYTILVSRGLGSALGITETLIKMAPLLLVSAGLLIALKASVWNIGIDGQFLIGASLAGILAPRLAGGVPLVGLLLICAGAAFIGGAVWGLAPAVLKVRYGLNEIITTIMMNYVAIYLTSWLVKGPFSDPAVVAPQMPTIPPEFRLPFLPFTRIHIGLLVGLLAVLLIYLMFRYGATGLALTILGRSRKAALHAGLPVNRLVALALLLSAGMAGLAGANDVLGVKGLFQGEWNPMYGLTAFALVFLARLNGLLVIPFAYFFAFLLFGGEVMARTARIPAYFVPLLEGLMLLFFAVSTYLERRYLRGLEP